MIGGLIMAAAKMTQEDLMVQILQERIERLKSLPLEEAKKESLQPFVEAGIKDETGKFTGIYAVLNEYGI